MVGIRVQLAHPIRPSSGVNDPYLFCLLTGAACELPESLDQEYTLGGLLDAGGQLSHGFND